MNRPLTFAHLFDHMLALLSTVQNISLFFQQRKKKQNVDLRFYITHRTEHIMHRTHVKIVVVLVFIFYLKGSVYKGPFANTLKCPFEIERK